ncbi:MAG: hypothetical protein WAV20_16155 [Blastocatellia bacterium]
MVAMIAATSPLTAYFDESYNHTNPKRPAEPPVYTVGCWLSTAKEWARFGRRWKTILKQAGVPFFHMTDYESRWGHYKDWSNSKRLKVLRELHQAVKDYAIYGNATVLNRCSRISRNREAT